MVLVLVIPAMLVAAWLVGKGMPVLELSGRVDIMAL